MNVQHLDHLNLSVLNFKATADWYRRVFGFEIVEQGLYAGQPWGVIKGGEAMLCIYQLPEGRLMKSEEAKEQKLLSMEHFALRIKDRALWEEVVTQQGVHVEYGGAYRWPHSLSWYIRDPNGYRIEVVLWDQGRPSF